MLAFLAGRAREPRLLVGAAGYLVLALGHALTLEAPPQDLFVARTSSGSGAPAILTAALAVAAWPTLDPLIALLVVAAVAGLAGGAVIKNLGASSRRRWPAAALASGAVLIATGAVHYFELPFVVVPGAAAALLLATHLAAGRPSAVRYAG